MIRGSPAPRRQLGVEHACARRMTVRASPLIAIALLVGLVAPARGQRSCEPIRPAAPSTSAQWTPPLDARLTVHARELTLRDALDRVSAIAHIQLAYSSDLLPLDRRVCLEADDGRVGDVLSVLLAGTGVQASVVAGRVVLAPSLAPHASERLLDVSTLERVVVTGNAAASPRRSSTIGIETIEGDEIRRRGLTTLSEIVNSGVPGMWVWERDPSSLVAQYGSIRGASSFSSSAPKIYIDGVEVANPLLVSQFDPDMIDRVEVIRGPQGAALYGSDAISGVINIMTRHLVTPDGAGRLRVASSLGGGTSQFGTNFVRTHDERISFAGGSNLRSASVGAEYGQVGAVFPSSESSQLLVAGNARVIGERTTLNATGRFFAKRAGAGANPLIGQLLPIANGNTSGGQTPPAYEQPGDRSGWEARSPNDGSAPIGADSTPQSLRQYTVGVNGTLATDGRWTHNILLGGDGYQLDHVADASGPFPLSLDSALRAAQGSGDRATLRLTSVGRFGDESSVATSTLSFGVEHSVLRQVQALGYSQPAQYGPPTYVSAQVESWNHNTGLFSQLNSEWRNTLYLTAGLRIERNDAFSGHDRYPLLPMLGIAVVRDIGGAELKLRSAYGRGIRPPRTPTRSTSRMQYGLLGSQIKLDPESQSGIETGAELYLGHVSLQVTRFDQLASGLIQNVVTAVDTVTRGGVQERHARYQLQNVGEIGNHGWEMQAAMRRGALTVDASLTLVDSRVRTLAAGYGGDLRPGDRLLAVPAQSASLSATWTGDRWVAALTATRAQDWINYDRLALSTALTAQDAPPPRELAGENLRNYWMLYDGETQVRVTLSRELGRGFELQLTGDNLLGGQLGQPDNVTIRQGRTVMGGARLSF